MLVITFTAIIMCDCKYNYYLPLFCVNFRTIVKTSENIATLRILWTSSAVLQTNFVISASILSTNFDILNNLPMCLYRLFDVQYLPEANQD